MPPSKRTRFEQNLAETATSLAQTAGVQTGIIARMQEQIEALFRLARGAPGRIDADAERAQIAPSKTDGATKPMRKLTKRQREIAALIANGMSNEEIAERLHISFDTARAHRANIYGRL